MKKTVLCVCLLLLFSFRAAGEVELVFHLPFENGSVDDIAGGMEGQQIGGKFVEGKVGEGIYFDGKERETECVVYGAAANDRFFQDFEEGPFTISVWIKPDSEKAHNRWQEILNKGSGVGPGWRLFYYYRMVTLRSGTGERDEEGNPDLWQIQTNPATDIVHPDQWNHIAVVRDEDGIVSLYLNGRKAVESEEKFDIIPSSHPLTLGSFQRGFAYGFMGVMDEIKIFRGALQSADILREYRNADRRVPIKLDGILDEDIWKTGRVFSDFYERMENTPPEVQTKVIFNYDEENLYFAFICDEPRIAELKNDATENSLAQAYRDDSIEIMIDSDSDRADYYHIVINPSGYYGVAFREQIGVVASEIENFTLFIGASIEEDRWVVEAAIPFSSLALEEGPKEEILFNFARNRRVDYRQESSIAQRGEYHNPFAFKPAAIKNVDLSLYTFTARPPEIIETRMKGEFIDVRLKAGIENPVSQGRDLMISLHEPDLGVLSLSRLQISPNAFEDLIFDFVVPAAGEYNLGLDIKDRGKIIYEAVFPVEISYVPLAIDLLRPIYRNSIYSKQKLDRIMLNVDIGLDKEELAGAEGQVAILDDRGRAIFQTGFIPSRENAVSFDKPDLEDGEYKIQVRLAKQGETLFENSVPLYKLPPAKGNEVYIDERLNLVLNGKPMLPLIWWTGSPVEEIAQMGADGVLSPSGPGAVQGLDALYELNQFATPMLLWPSEYRRLLGGTETLSDEAIAFITNRVEPIKDHPAVLFYYFMDEPEGHNISPRVIKEAYELVKELDPYTPIQLTNYSVRAIRTYIDCADMFLPDHYMRPLEDGTFTRSMTSIIPFMEEIMRAGRGRKMPGLTPQAFDGGRMYAARPPHSTRNNRAPTFVEVRCRNYLAIVYGAKAFNYYVYGDSSKPDDNWGAVHVPDLRVGKPYLIREKKSLSSVILLGADITPEVKTNNENVHFMAKEYEGSRYIFAVNVVPEEIRAEIRVPSDIRRLKIISENRQINARNGIFTDVFAPYHVHIYTDNLSFRDEIELSRVKNEIKEAGGWFDYSY